MTIFEALDEANKRLRAALERCVICGQSPEDERPCDECKSDLEFLDHQDD